VNLYWDGQHAWQVLRMAGAEQNWDKLGGALLGSVVVIACCSWCCATCSRCSGRA